jgi:hypothetical protein
MKFISFYENFEGPGSVRGRFWGGFGRFLAGYRRFGRLFEGSGRFGSGVWGV